MKLTYNVVTKIEAVEPDTDDTFTTETFHVAIIAVIEFRWSSVKVLLTTGEMFELDSDNFISITAK